MLKLPLTSSVAEMLKFEVNWKLSTAWPRMTAPELSDVLGEAKLPPVKPVARLSKSVPVLVSPLTKKSVSVGPPETVTPSPLSSDAV